MNNCKECKDFLDKNLIYNQSDYRKWMAKNHPDKFRQFGEDDERYINASKKTRMATSCFPDWYVGDPPKCKINSTDYSGETPGPIPGKSRRPAPGSFYTYSTPFGWKSSRHNQDKSDEPSTKPSSTGPKKKYSKKPRKRTTKPKS